MCGISGIINTSGELVSEEKILRMMHKMKHRGPNDEGHFIKDGVALGFVRLSIIDLSESGHQPMYSSNRNLIIVFNGEIFNYIELREELKALGHNFQTDTDTEVLLNSYIEWGEECQHRFNGMWAFAIFDIAKNKLFISRDRYGIKPLYYYFDGITFAFASEISSLLEIISEKPEANEQAIFDYLVFNRTDQTNQTFFNNIYKIQHGHSLMINCNQDLKIEDNLKKWYDLKKEIENKKNLSASVNTFNELLIDAVKIRLRSDVPVGVCLSGGLDSSAITSIIIKNFGKHDLNTFSAVYEPNQFGDESNFIKLFEPELENMFYIKPTADSLLLDLQKFVKVQTEPIPATGPYAQYKVMELAQKHVVVTLDGQGADEMLAGYHYFFGFYFKDLLKRWKIFSFIKEIIHYLKIHKSVYGLKTMVYFILPKKIRTKVRVGERSYLDNDFVSKYSDSNSIAGELYEANSLKEALLNHFEFKLEHLLKWEDRNSMAFSIEARVPFLDHRLVEFTLSINDNLIIKNGMTKYLLRESMKGILPEKIRTRQDKVGFDTPQDDWFRLPQFKQLIIEILESESFKSRKIVDAEKAKQLYSKHLSGEISISKDIWKWIHLELWYRLFIDNGTTV